jgi:hypothetical protein
MVEVRSPRGEAEYPEYPKANWMTTIRALIAISLLALWIPAVPAQSTEPDQKSLFAGYVNSPGYRGYLEKIFNAAEWPTLRAQCSSLRILESNKVVVVEEPRFVRAGANYNIDTGTWIAVAGLDRCGVGVTRRALLKAVPGANLLDATFLLPGDFRGNLKLEADALRIIMPGLMVTAECRDTKTFRVLDVTALGPSSPQGWSEKWIAEACRRAVEADVTYRAIAGGMNISATNLKLR